MDCNWTSNIGYTLIALKCDALQQNREQVTQAYFEIRAIEVGTVVKTDSSVDFDFFFFFLLFMYLYMS